MRSPASVTEPGAVWITRPAPNNAATARAVAAAGYDVLLIPVLEVGPTPPAPLPTGAWPDWLVFVSANAVLGFVAATRAPGFPRRDPARPIAVAAVGRQTAAAAAAAGFTVTLVPDDQHGDGLVAAFATTALQHRSVWIPSGGRAGSATRTLPAALAARGALPSVFQVYDTRDRPLSAADLTALDTRAPGAVVYHSPSAAAALYHQHQPPAVRRLCDRVACVAIGATTAARLAELGAPRVWVCNEPSDAGLVELLSRVFFRGEGSPR
ncbi:MAG: uroporphyrinogen-III synthase [Deltaproteobacteria bacterium]|nr:uroporphyrinogen-III synthase [Deltaproteobacteria bacterium]